jgi:ACR3 family arsenite transporter
MGILGRWLSLWVALAITAGIGLGQLFPGVFSTLAMNWPVKPAASAEW